MTMEILASLLLANGASLPNASSNTIDCGIYSSSEEWLNESENDSVALLTETEGPQKLKTYFSNLCDYPPMNSCGSCANVSLAQCLSYYDTIYNDDIIPEKYEASFGNASNLSNAASNSPGVIRKAYPECNYHLYPKPKFDEYPSYADTSFYEHVKANKDTDFQMLLMDETNLVNNRDPLYYRCSSHMRNYQKVLDKLHQEYESDIPQLKFEYQGYDYDDKTLKISAIQETLKEYTIKQIEDDKPVVLHLASYDTDTDELLSYHSVVAYDYDSSGSIYANFGWSSGYAHAKIDFDTWYITDVGVFDMASVEEKHSDNYEINGKKYCGCEVLNHEHSYTDHYETYSSEKHIAYCSCGDSTFKSHVYITERPYLIPLPFCRLCGQSKS